MLHVFGGEKRGAADQLSVVELSESSKEKPTIDTIVVGRIADDGVSAALGEIILTVDLVLAAIDSG